jgi:cellulose synthase/poly-beta-1,6-N-acetylglucosamine synthase-like glycosyltransferase
MLLLTLLFWTGLALILYTYCLFPLLLHVVSRRFGRKEELPADLPDAELPRVAMIVAAYNEAGVLDRKLENSWAIDYPADRFRLLVGSDGSDDGSDAILRACRDPRLKAALFHDRRGKISVLNDLAAAADADILVMSDANTMYAPDAVRKLVRHFQLPWVGCVSGELALEGDGGSSGEGLYWRYEQWIKRSESRLGFLIGCNGGIYALRRELYSWLPASTIVDDFVLSLRVLEQGKLVIFDPSARAVEPPCSSSGAEMTRKVRIGAGGFQALGLTRSLLGPRAGMRAFAFWGHKVLRWMVPFFFLASLLSAAALTAAQPESPLYPAFLALSALGGAVSAAAWRFPYLALPRWTRPFTYFYLMNFALFCGFWRFALRTQKVTWDRDPSRAALGDRGRAVQGSALWVDASGGAA